LFHGLSTSFVSLSHLLSFLFLRDKSFSRDHSSFFGSGETEKKLSFELNQLKAKLASKEVELDSECQGCQDSERALRVQVIEAEQRRDEAMAALQESSEKCKGLKKECEDTLSSFLFLCFFISIILF
jgi:hypothetical protein